MDLNGFYDKLTLTTLLDKCIYVERLNEEENVELKNSLIEKLRHIWTAIGANEFLCSNTWLLYCRIGAIGLHILSETDELFCDSVHMLSSLGHNATQVCIQEIDVVSLINSPEMFQISVLYGALHLLIIRKELYTRKFRFLYDYIIIQSQQQSRHNSLYFQMLSCFVQNFSKHITVEEYTDIFATVYYNLDKKDCCSILQYILNKTDKLEASHVFHSVLFSMSWKYKQKYILLNAILQDKNLLKEGSVHDECIQGLIYAQSNTYLATSGAKLYNAIIKHLGKDLWLEKYYPALEAIIIKPETTTLCQKNILKYYMNSTSYLPLNFKDLLEKLLALENVPVYTLLFLTLVGIKQKQFPENFNFMKVINLGCDNKDDYIRAMTFHVICATTITDIRSARSFDHMKNYFQFNINDAGPASRDSIIKSYSFFLTHLERKICLPTKRSADALVCSADFFEWFIPFLFEQFKPTSNYQRLTLSFSLLHTTLHSFSNRKTIYDKDSLKNYTNFLSSVSVFYDINAFLPEFMNVLKMCQMEEAQKMIHILLSNIKFSQISEQKISDIEVLGLENICNSNMEVAEFGKKLLIFVNNIESVTKQSRLESVIEMMQQQWHKIKFSLSEDIIVENPLYPLISVFTSTYTSYDPKVYDKIFEFIEDIVANLLNVFGIRAMLPYNSTCCVGVAKAFQNEDSEFHSCAINCMWLVLKACCKLSVVIAKSVRRADIIRRTLYLLNSVIQKCYHKGALEEAGEALAQIISSATFDIYGIFEIHEFLQTVLESVRAAKETSSTVRRAAEIRIVLSAIAINDKRAQKPLFHTTMDSLIEIIKDCLLARKPLKDPVHSLALHCLQPIIRNNFVETHIVEHISTIAIISLSSFESKNWKVRNAALQTFNAVSNKLLGTTLSSDDDSVQHHATCMEEIIFKYAAIYQYILAIICESTVLPEKQSDVIIPVLSFINLSYARDDQLVECTKIKMSELTKRLQNYIDVGGNFKKYVISSKAYSSIRYFREIINDIQRLCICISGTVDNRTYMSIIYTLKMLSDKVIEDADMLPNYKNIVSDTLEKIQVALENSLNRKLFHKSISGILFYRPQSVTVEQILNDLIYLNTNSEIASELPGIWECMEKKLKFILKTNEIKEISNLIKYCLDKSVPLNIQVSCIRILKDRIQQDELACEFCAEELIHVFIKVILDKENMWIKYLSEEMVSLIIQLNVTTVDEDIMNKILSSIDDLKKKLYPRSYMAAFCSICGCVFEKNINIVKFLEWCTLECIIHLEDDDPDILILKSVKFIWLYGCVNNIDSIKFQALKVIYKMLQRDEFEIKTECDIILSSYLSLTPKHTHVNVLDFIKRDCLIRLLNPNLALMFLVEIYSEREEISYSINVFDRKFTLAFETDIVEEVIYEQVFYIYLNEIRKSDRYDINNWYKKYKNDHPNNQFIRRFRKIIKYL